MVEVYRSLLLAFGACGLVLLLAYLLQKNKATSNKSTKIYRVYQSQTYTAAQCQDFLKNTNIHDTFAYTLTPSPKGTEICFTHYNPTQQIMATTFLLCFQQQQPAVFSLTFLREAFGNPEPVVPPALLDAFFSQKLSAVRVAESATAD